MQAKIVSSIQQHCYDQILTSMHLKMHTLPNAYTNCDEYFMMLWNHDTNLHLMKSHRIFCIEKGRDVDALG